MKEIRGKRKHTEKIKKTLKYPDVVNRKEGEVRN